MSCLRTVRHVFTDIAMYTVIYGAIILTIVGNSMVIISVSHFRQLHTPTNFLILSLATADFLLGLTVMPYSMVRSITACWYFGDLFCKVHSCIDMTLCTTSIFHLFFIAVDRYYAICQPLHYSRKITIPVIEVYVFISWSVPCLYSFGLVLSNVNIEGLEEETLVLCMGSCSLVFNKMWSILTSLLCFFIPGTLMIGLYIRIFSVARKQAKLINSIPNSTNQKKSSKNKSLVNAENKAAKTLSLVMGVFILCWLPFFILTVTDPYLNFSISDDIYNIVLWLGYFNSALNPIIYGLFYPWFKKSFLLILTGKILQLGSASYNRVLINVH
ncbi:trace amine-associated receptor 4-like [Bufo gargarizans]|uniref:trace amine-associated receptor 4-like n=1 Tax=Bufo gargarizans TaxID=30331 RepID=UPI001CF257C0|nr:trace amine-associated receptor 4-like [Bufo gargarizans]